MPRYLRPLVLAWMLSLTCALAGAPGAGAGGVDGRAWLGLNNNTVKYLGAVNAFSRHHVVYDRSFELTAGQLPSELEKGYETAEFENRLREDHQYGMIPVAVIEYRGYDRDGYVFKSDPEFPRERTAAEVAQGKNTIAGYVDGFVKSAAAILRLIDEKYPGMPVLLEPMNEPWGYTTPRFDAAQYAAVIARLLPAARWAHIPLGDIYVGATGRDCVFKGGSAEEECLTNGWVPAMYKAQPTLQTEIQGWYFHPYGPPSGAAYYDSEGIQSLPLVRSAMTSGQNNIVVSEVGYCAKDANQGKGCDGIGIQSSTKAAGNLTEMLDNALYYHQAGWLKALIVYSRNDGGWAMQSASDLTFTKQGEAFDAFANAYGLSWWSPQRSLDPFASLFSELSGVRCVPSVGCMAVRRYRFG